MCPDCFASGKYCDTRMHLHDLSLSWYQVTARQYLETALRSVSGSSSASQAKNQVIFSPPPDWLIHLVQPLQHVLKHAAQGHTFHIAANHLLACRFATPSKHCFLTETA